MKFILQEPEDAEDVDSEEYEDDDEFDHRHPRKRKKKANDRWSDNNCSILQILEFF